MLPTSPKHLTVEAHQDIDSTQARMKERIRADEDVHARVVRAERQLAGSGTRGRVWASERGGSYQTLAIRDRPPAPGTPERPLTAPGVSVAVGIGIASVLTDQGARVQVKWPNDLYYRGRKLGGILCEAFRGWLLVGVGVNVQNEPPPGATALRGWSLDTTHERILEGMLSGLHLWRSGASLREQFTAYDFLADQSVEVRTGGRTVCGVAAGITDDGALWVEHDVGDGTNGDANRGASRDAQTGAGGDAHGDAQRGEAIVDGTVIRIWSA